MTELPTPRRFVIQRYIGHEDKGFEIVCDDDVIRFVALLRPVNHVSPSHLEDRYTCWYDPRYAFDKATCEQTLAWITEQLEAEFGGTEVPARSQIEPPESTHED